MEKFQTLTTFDRVSQVVLIIDGNREGEGESNQSQIAPSEGGHSSHEQDVCDDPVHEMESPEIPLPPPAKKQKKKDTFQIGNIVESKKVGKVK